MPVAYLTAAVCSAFTLALIWVFTGGGWLSAFFIYVISGNLVLGGFILRVYFRKSDK